MKPSMPCAPLDLYRHPSGRLMLRSGRAGIPVAVVPVRAFPISAPDVQLSLIDDEGLEQVGIGSLDALVPAERALILGELGRREFMPSIERIVAVSRHITPCTWTVETDRGRRDFVLKAEESIRRLPGKRLLIADSNGIEYLLADRDALDERSRRLLDRFM